MVAQPLEQTASEPVEETPAPLFNTPVEEKAEETPEPDEQEVEKEAAEEPDKLSVLEQRLAEVQEKLQRYESQKSPEEIRAEAEAEIQRKETVRRQREERSKADQAELHESLAAALVAAGFTEADPTAIARVGERFINKRHDQIKNGAITEVGTALRWIDATLRGGKPPALSDEASGYAEQFLDQFRNIYGSFESRAVEGLKATHISLDDHKKAIAAAVKEAKASVRNDTTDVAQVQGRALNGRTEAEVLADPTTPIDVLKEIRSRQKKGG